MTNKNLIALRVSDEILKILKDRCQKHKIEQSEFIRQAIIEHCGYTYIPAKIIKK